MKRGSSPSSNSSQSSSEQCIPGWSKMVVLADSDVTVPKRLFERLSKSRVSLFTQELAVLIFGKDTLTKSTLTGKSGMQNEKEQLDPHKVNVLIECIWHKKDIMIIFIITVSLTQTLSNSNSLIRQCQKSAP